MVKKQWPGWEWARRKFKTLELADIFLLGLLLLWVLLAAAWVFPWL